MVYFGGELYLNTKEGYVIEAHIYIKGKELVEEDAYILDDRVYIYHGHFNKYSKIKKYGIYKKNNEYIFIEPGEDEIYYTIEDIKHLDTDEIFADIEKNAKNYIEMMNTEIIDNSKEVYMPTVEAEDDFLKAGIKMAIIGKDVNYKIYKNKVPGKNGLNNKFSSIKAKGTKVTVNVFKFWLDLLNVDCKIILSDNGKDKQYPLKEDIVIDLRDY